MTIPMDNDPSENECDETRLAVLLVGDERSDEFQHSAEHVQSCEHCQNRLTKLAADEQTWNEVTESLAEDDTPFDVTAPHLAGLMSPSHPELFGRLGRYEIEGVIGSGGMGVVLKGHDTELNRPVAIKLLAHHLAHNGAARQRFAREARAAAAVVHEHVVAIHNIESEAETPFMVMQYVSGESLQARVDQRGPLGVKEILRIGMQAAAGLSAAHVQGVVHRDVKPANILLEHGVERTLLTDFGLARVADDATVTRTGIVAGTPNYMSPEQANGDATDHRSDLFSLGAVLYFMATGRSPFRAERAMAVLKRICDEPHRPVWEANPEIPDELSDVIDRLLEKKPQRRFATAEQVQQTLSTLLAKLQETGCLRRRASYRRWSSTKRRKLVLGLLAGSAGVAVVSLSGVLNGEKPNREESNRPSTNVATPQPEVNQAQIDFERLQAADVSPLSEFMSELVEVQDTLQQLEIQPASEGHILLKHSNDGWQGKLDAVESELLNVESLLNDESLLNTPPSSGEE